MFALFSADDLLLEAQGQLTLDVLGTGAVAEVPLSGPVMPRPWALIPREEITGQGVLGA